MISWLSRHRPRRRGAKKPPAQSPPSASKAEDVALVGMSTGLTQRPPGLRSIKRQDTDATLVDESDFHSDSETSVFDADSKVPLARCASPDSFDSPPIKKERAPRRAVTPCANPDDPSLRKKLQVQETGPQCFGPVPLDCEPPVKVHRSRWSKFASGATHSVSAILEASIVVGEASNIPYLKGLAGIILLVSNSVQDTEDNRVDCLRLSKMVLQLANSAARQVDEQADPHQFSLGIQSLTRAFTRILQALQTSIKRSYARRLIESTNERGLLQDCEKELQHCLDVFQIRTHIITSVALRRKDSADQAFADQVASVLLPVKDRLAQPVSESVETPEVSVTSDAPSDLPPMPQIFNGRDSELSELVQMFARPQQAHAVLMGEGGAGKSSLAVALMHQPQIKEIFRHKRVLVQCDLAPDSFGILSRLASALGLPDISDASKSAGYKETIVASLECSQVPALIVFDNLDNAWDPPTTRLEVEDLLTELSNISTVSLLLTLRGTQRPLGPAYSKPYPAPLGPVAPIAARQTFFAISDVPEDGVDAPLVDVLLHMVGFLPMPITLLAQLAQYEPLPFLIERYREEGTAMLYSGDVSLESSIEASLYSARVSECPAALEVLGILAKFPDGIPKTQVTALVVGGGRLPGAMVNKCLSILHKTSLVTVVPPNQDARQERLKVPEIVRTYLERHVLDGRRFRSTEEDLT